MGNLLGRIRPQFWRGDVQHVEMQLFNPDGSPYSPGGGEATDLTELTTMVTNVANAYADLADTVAELNTPSSLPPSVLVGDVVSTFDDGWMSDVTGVVGWTYDFDNAVLTPPNNSSQDWVVFVPGTQSPVEVTDQGTAFTFRWLVPEYSEEGGFVYQEMNPPAEFTFIAVPRVSEVATN